MTLVNESSDDREVIITASSVTIAIVILVILVIVIITVVLAKKFGQSKVVLQVTGNSFDIIGDSNLPSIFLHR